MCASITNKHLHILFPVAVPLQPYCVNNTYTLWAFWRALCRAHGHVFLVKEKAWPVTTRVNSRQYQNDHFFHRNTESYYLTIVWYLQKLVKTPLNFKGKDFFMSPLTKPWGSYRVVSGKLNKCWWQSCNLRVIRVTHQVTSCFKYTSWSKCFPIAGVYVKIHS
jgi:hypothetical protein